jgi:hypothetical protein
MNRLKYLREQGYPLAVLWPEDLGLPPQEDRIHHRISHEVREAVRDFTHGYKF